MRTKQSLLGFTLVELMIVLVVIGILASIAVPSYLDYMKRARRADAQALMMTIAGKQQQYLLDARAFTGNPVALGIGRQNWTCTATGCSNAWYSVAVQVGTAAPPSFSVSATPVSGTAQESDGTLSLTSADVRERKVGGVDKGW